MFEGERNDIEKAVKLLKAINHNMKVDHMMKDVWDGVTEEETREHIEDFGLINIAISALEKQIPKKPVKDREYTLCPNCKKVEIDWLDNYCHGCSQRLDWSVRE